MPCVCVWCTYIYIYIAHGKSPSSFEVEKNGESTSSVGRCLFDFRD